MVKGSEGAADRELEALQVVAELAPGVAAIADREGIAEAEQAERREPLHADADRDAQLLQLEAGVGGKAGLVEELRVAEVEGLAEVEEHAAAHAARELRRHRHDRFELSAQRAVAAVRIAERVARAKREIAEAADRVGAADEEVPIRRQPGRVAERRAIAEVGVEAERQR